MLQEEINSSQGTEGETPSDEVEKAPSVTKAAQVEDSLLHYLSFRKLSLNALKKSFTFVEILLSSHLTFSLCDSLQLHRVKNWIDSSRRKPFGSHRRLTIPKRDGE